MAKTLVMLVGPPAVGKMAVGRELERITGLPLLHNHMTIDPVLPFFEFGSPPFSRLVGGFRDSIVREVLESDLPGLIFTFVWAFDDPSDHRYVRTLAGRFEERGGRAVFVELRASLKTRLQRNRTALRWLEKPSKRDLEASERRLMSMEERCTMTSEGDPGFSDYLVLETDGMKAARAAERIVERFSLPRDLDAHARADCAAAVPASFPGYGSPVGAGDADRDRLDGLRGTDIYLLDQLMRGRITSEMSILDAGCGGGRNARCLIGSGADVFGIDRDPEQVARARRSAARVAPDYDEDRFQVGELDALAFPDGHFDAVVCSAVLHFSDDQDHFRRCVREMFRVLEGGGVFFARLASTIGIETRVERLSNGWYHLPDGTDRFLVDESLLASVEEELGAERIDPLKTTNVDRRRAMTTWVLRKR